MRRPLMRIALVLAALVLVALGLDLSGAGVQVLRTVMALGMLLALYLLASASGSGNRIAKLLLGRAPRPEGMPVILSPRHLLTLIPWSAASWLAGVGALFVILVALNPGQDVNIGDVV